MTITDFLNQCKPSSPKWGVMFFGSLLWAFAAYRILTLSVKHFLNIENIRLYVIIGFVGFLIFFFGVFLRVSSKYIHRMKLYEISRPCIFAFFNIKGYTLMIIMIIGGVLFSKVNSIAPNVKAAFYMALGLSLLTSAVLFLLAGISFMKPSRKEKTDTKNNDQT